MRGSPVRSRSVALIGRKDGKTERRKDGKLTGTTKGRRDAGPSHFPSFRPSVLPSVYCLSYTRLVVCSPFGVVRVVTTVIVLPSSLRVRTSFDVTVISPLGPLNVLVDSMTSELPSQWALLLVSPPRMPGLGL